MDDLKDRRGYCELKEEALDRTVWRNRFARGFGPLVWQITDDDDDDDDTISVFFTSKCSLFHNSNMYGSCIIHILYIYSTNIGTEYFKHCIKWKANWIVHILRRNCLLKQVIEGKKTDRSDKKTRKKA